MRRLGCLVVCVGVTGCELVFSPGGSETPDATAVADAPIDSDGDLVLDPDDNCPAIPNPSQIDEDGDRVGDLCDNCVGISNVAQLDGGELPATPDGIGDACDPDGGAANRVVARYFVENGDDPGNDWEMVSGAWTLGGAHAEVLDAEADDATLLYASKLANGAVLEIGFDVIAVGTLAAGEHAGFGAWIDAAPPDGRLCEVRTYYAAPYARLEIDDRIAGIQQSEQFPTQLAETRTTLVVRGTTDAGVTQYACVDPVVMGEPGNVFTTGASLPELPGRFGLHAANAAVRIRYVVVYEPL